MNATKSLDRLASAWQERLHSAEFVFGWASLVAAVVLGGLVARVGSLPLRLAGAGCIVLALASWLARVTRQGRDFKSPQRAIRRVLLPAERSLGERALRAAELAEHTRAEPALGSSELAQLHFERLLAKASLSAVNAESARRARYWRMGAFALVLAAGAGMSTDPDRVLEGLDVMAARAGRAPFPMTWLELVRVSAQQPAYLHAADRVVFPGAASAQPRGSTIVVRGLPVREGRRLVLSDGSKEVPFVDDAAGGVVAHYALDRDVDLKIGARFGAVLVLEPVALELKAIPDEAPHVELEGAPRTIALRSVDRVELDYTAEDDHGLRQIDLVLQSGAREERRTLARLDGETRSQHGAHALDARDPFLKRMFLPVEVRIEARDTDTLTNHKWGQSQAMTLLVPELGAAEADRYRALLAARGVLADLLAWQISTPLGAPGRRNEQRTRLERASLELRSAIRNGFYDARSLSGLRAFLEGQVRVLERPLASANGSTRRTEAVTLAVDAALRAVGSRDARSVAIHLGDVAEEGADGAKQALETERRQQGLHRLDTALGVLDAGAAHLIELGALGADLGSVAQGEVRRIRRARAEGSMLHAELAARHLAMRLRRPNPSFASAGRGGVESGGTSQTGEEPSDADRKFDELIGELERLASEHAQGIEQVEGELSEASKSVKLDALKEEAAQRAARLRDKIARLPQFSDEPGSARSSAALAREHLDAMAQGLERLALRDSVESGRAGVSELDEASRKAQNPSGIGDFLERPELSDARTEAASSLAWAEQALGQAQADAQARAQAGLAEAARREQSFADRAGNLAGRGNHGEVELPEDLAEALGKAEGVMRDAARELAAAQGERALSLQREAQRLLEQTNRNDAGQSDDQQRESNSGKGGDGRRMRTDAEVPQPGNGADARDFRRRVLEGLGRDPGGRLSPAVRRYAEGLLK